MKITALQLSQAGFDTDTIKSYVDTQIPLLEKAGFNKKEIYNSYGIVPIKSNSLLDTDMQEDTTAITENQLPLGKKTSLMKLQDEENANTIKSNKTSDGKYNLKNTTFDLLKNEDQAKIVNKIDEAYKLFKEDDDGRVGFIDNWMEKYYPNIAYEKEKFKGGVDLTLAESALNDEQVKLLENAQAKDAIAGNFGFNQETGRYLFDTNFEQAEDERKANEPVNVLHTAFSTGANSKTILEYAKQNYQFNDMQIMYLNEFMSFVSALESNNRNIYNADGSAGGLFQFRKSGFRTALNRFVNINRKINKDYELPYWVTEAFKHQDPTRLSPDEQKSLALANFLEMPKSEKYNRAGSDQLIKAIANGDVDAMKKLYIEYHHADYEKVEDIEAGVGQEYRLVDNQKLKERTDQYFDKFGTDKYNYETAQLAYWGNDNIVTKALEKLPANIGDKVLNAFGGKGYYNVFTNGYEQSVNGMLDRYYQVFIDDPNADPKEAIQKVFMFQEQRFDKDIVASAVTLVNDLPFMAAGCFAAGGTALVGSAGTAAPALPVICGAGGFALPEVIRSAYMRAIEDNFVGSFPEFLSHYMDKKTAIVAGKTAVIGGVTFGVGAKIKTLTGSTTARLASEVSVMTTLGAALEGHVPTMRDFAHATVLVFGIHGSIRGMKMFKDIYTEYGRHPRDVIKDMEKDVTVRHQIENGQMPTLYEQGAKTVVEGLEKQTNIKLLPPPKFKNNEIVNVSTSSTEVGRVIGKETIGNEKVVIVEKTNGAKIPVLESEVRKAPNKPVEVKIEGDKININFAKDTSFAERKSNGEFNVNIVEVTKNKQNIYTEGTFKSNADLAVRDTGSAIRIVTKDGKTIANETITIQSKFYPELAKRFKENKEQKTEYNNAKELITKERNGLSSVAKKVEILFALKGNIEKMILRVGKDNVAIPRSAYEQLIKFTEKGEVKTAEIMGSEGRQVIMMLHPETGKILATIKGEKINGEIDAQATNYFDNFKEKEGVYFDRVNSSKDGDNWGIPRDIFTQEKNLPADYANNSAAWKGLFNSAKGLDMIDLVELYKAFVKKSPELNNLPTGLNGYFQFKGKKSPRIVINEALQKNPEQFLMTFAHELGHLIDYLPDATLKRGNILGSIASLKGFMNKWIDGKNDGARPLDPKEIANLKKQAEKIAKEREKTTDKEIIEDLKITPETVLQIFRDADARAKIDPAFYDAFAKLSDSLKKEVVKDAMKGLMSHHIKAIADKVNGKTVDPKLTDEAYKIFKQMFEKEVKERGLVNKEWIEQELKSLSMKWKPFDRTRTDAAGVRYTKYRDGPRELMADFMMAWLLRPNWVKHNAPRTYEMWNYYIDAKPEVKAIWEQIQIDITAGPNVRYGNVVKSIGTMFRDVNKQILDKIEKEWKPDMVDWLGQEAIDSFFWIYRRLGGSGRERWHSPFAKELNWAIENFRYRHAKLKRYMDEMKKHVIKPARDLGYTEHEVATMLFLRNIAESTQRENLVSSLGIRKYSPELAKQLEVRDAKDVFDYYAQLHPELLRITDAFYEVRQRMVIPEIKESGMYDAELISKLENNKEYVTFNVKKHLLKRLEKYGANSVATRYLKSSKGTLDEIQNVFNATMEKDMILLIEARRHKLMAMTVQWLKDNKTWLENYEGVLKNGKKDLIIQKPKFVGEGKLEPAPKGMKLFSYMKDGKLENWFVNKFVAQAFEQNPFATMQMFKWMTRTGDVFRKFFTEYNPAFWPINMARDINRSVKLLPNARYFDIVGGGKNSYIKYLFKSLKPAYKSIFGDGTALTRWMEEEGFLISMVEGYRGQAGSNATKRGLDPDTYMLERLLSDTAKREGGLGGLYDRTFGELFNKLGNFARMFERTPKIAGVLYLRDQIKRGKIKMDDKEMMLRIQSEVGSPNFLRQGRLNSFSNNLWLYSNAFKEGWRADITRFKEDPVSVGGKFIAYNAMPKVLQKAMEIGFFGTSLGYLYYYGVSEWDRINYIPIVLGVTPDGRPVYFRIPQDESSRIINGMLYKMMGIIDDKEGAGVLETPADLFGYVGTSGLPSTNPVFNLFEDLFTWMQGNTPHDDFRNTGAIDKTTETAGGLRKHLGILKWMLNTYTGQGVYKFKSNDMNEIQTELEKVLDLPIVGRVINRFIKIGQNPAVEYMKKGEDGIEAYDKAQANLTLDYKEAIVRLTEGKPLEEKHKQAMAIKNQDLLGNNLMVQRIVQMAGGDMIIQELLTEKDNKKRVIMMYKLIDYIEKTDSNYPVETKPK